MWIHELGHTKCCNNHISKTFKTCRKVQSIIVSSRTISWSNFKFSVKVEGCFSEEIKSFPSSQQTWVWVKLCIKNDGYVLHKKRETYTKFTSVFHSRKNLLPYLKLMRFLTIQILGRSWSLVSVWLTFEYFSERHIFRSFVMSYEKHSEVTFSVNVWKR